MNTPNSDKPKLSIKAQHVGPIMSLNASLSSERQNLIFARNGTGKSFLARSLRLLDDEATLGFDEHEIPKLLVSEESTNRQGYFRLSVGENCVGSLDLNAQNNTVSKSQPDYIFHVFSEDYVDFHLRQKGYEPDGEISHEIIVGQDNSLLEKKRTQLTTANEQYTQKRSNLDEQFNKRRETLKREFQINKQLGAYKSLSSGTFFEAVPYEASGDGKMIHELLTDYTDFKSLPPDATVAEFPKWEHLSLDFIAIKEALGKVTSPSVVAETFKAKIATDPAFYERGSAKYQENSSECPFCTQSLSANALQAINAYVDYFNDAEAREKSNLERLMKEVDVAQMSVESWQTRCLFAKESFDDLKRYFPSVRDKQYREVSSHCGQIDVFLENLKGKLKEKLANLTQVLTPSANSLNIAAEALETATTENRSLASEIAKLIDDSGTERKKIQNAACKALEREFALATAKEILEVRELTTQSNILRTEISDLRKTQGDKADARARVAETFKGLLQRFFGDKYVFDEETFIVSRGDTARLRQIDRTLSDGEKAVMAFCYFLAQSHLKVESNEDYERLFYVFDDPVTSMSFDFVYTIVQTLKYLRVGTAGEIVFDPNSSHPRPRMLILTHNNYFYNVASSNRAVKPAGLFQLVPSANGHILSSQKGFATPHQQQLKHVLAVSEGREDADYRTPNCIRSVIEGMWKFCRPDLNDFGKFTEVLINDHNIEIKSVMINDLSHGGKFDDPPHKEEDIILAAKEAIEVVRNFAEGQLS